MVLSGTPQVRRPLEGLGVNDRIMLRSIGVWTGSSWLRIGRSGEPL